jgi:hypothetical protein
MKKSIIVAALCCAGCAARPERADQMSVASHREEAARQRTEAERDYERFRPSVRASVPGTYVGPGDTPRAYPLELFSFDPTERAIADAERHLRHAREHEAAAAELERYEEAECRGFGPHTRAACPVLGPVTRIDDTAEGVRISFVDEPQARAMAALMRCHLAFARARGFRDAGDCPLYLSGIEIGQASGASVEVSSKAPAVAREIRVRSRMTSTR